MATIEQQAPTAEDRIVLTGISWEMYEVPPDLVVETEVSRGAVSRLRIYAGLGVPEIWRWRNDSLTAYSLAAEGQYIEREFSLNLPMLRVKDLEPFLDFNLAADETAWIGQFRAWVGERFPAGK